MSLFTLFILIFFFLIILMFIIIKLIDFFKRNTFKDLINILFQKDNRFILLVIIIFTFIFWFSFNLIYDQTRVYKIKIIQENDSNSQIYYEEIDNSKKILTLKNGIELEIVKITNNDITFKTNQLLTLYQNNEVSFLKQNDEFTLDKKYPVTLDIMDSTTYKIMFIN